MSIINIAYLMEEDGASMSPDKREVFAWMKRLRDKVAYMDKIVSDLQDMVRPLSVDGREIRLDRLFMDVLNDLKVPGKVRVNLKINSGADRVVTDLRILRRILHNLVKNAF